MVDKENKNRMINHNNAKVHNLLFKWSIIIVLITALLLSVAFVFMWRSQHPSYKQMERGLNQNEQLWASKALSDYSFQLSIMPAPAGPWTGFVAVNQGIASVTYEHDDADFVNSVSQYYNDANSIEKLFSIIRRTLTEHDVDVGVESAGTPNSPSREMPDIFEVSYDPDLGYPSSIYIKYDKQAFEGFISYQVSNFYIINQN